ncbi:MAG: hypothetical protein NVV74_11060 [Magnetospirillum sp.]|nr:hypothetical protein [Magnetospirillum sp.]
MQPTQRSINQQTGGNRLMTATLAALLLALVAAVGNPLAFRSPSALLLMGGGGDRSAGLAVGSGENGLAWARSAACAKPGRPQLLGGGGSNPKSTPEAALVPSGQNCAIGARASAIVPFHIAIQHMAASGQSTSRIPTGPPALVSPAA